MNENLLQYLWETLSFDFRNLQSINDEPVTIIDQGKANPGDGPDFTGASILINGLKFYGDVECHLKAKFWYDHNHHKDPRYNRVILHVVLFDDDLCEITRSDGTKPVTIVLKPYFPNRIWGLFRRMKQSHTLPCAGLIAETPQNIIQSQWEKAHNKYFEYKVNQLLELYPSGFPPSRAWKYMLSAGLFDALGITNNRQSMVQLHELLNQEELPSSITELIERAFVFSGLRPETSESQMKRNDWDFSSSRPNNQPDIRIPQACMLMHNLYKIPFETFLNGSITEIWEKISYIDQGTVTPIGKQRLAVLYFTVFVPGIFLLGNLLFINHLKSEARRVWDKNKLQLPQKIKRTFLNSGFPDLIAHIKTGTIFQYKHYCIPGNCQQCNLMKNFLKS